MTKPTDAPVPSPSSGVNIPLMVRDHARPDAKRLREKIAKLEKETRECRAELESVIAHAALEGIKIEQEHHPEPPAEPAP